MIAHVNLETGVMKLARIEPTRPLAEAAYRKAIAISEAWDGIKTVPVRHVGKPTYLRTTEGDWVVEWVGVPA